MSWKVGVAAVACLAAAAAASAQVGAGAISGVVRDQSGRPVPAAAVTVTAAATASSQTVFTAADGAYALPRMSPGVYAVRVDLAGFTTVEREGLRVATGEHARVDVTLVVGGATETVVVSAATPRLQSESGALGQLVEHERIVSLPLNGRSFISLAALSPGVALPPGSSLPRINGGRPRTNEYLFDGISVLQPEPGQVAYFPVVDAIQEFRVERNSPPAEFGRFNGGVVNLTTRAGGNRVSGTAFAFLRHEALNARNAFATDLDGKPRFRRTQAGGVLGGPVKKDRTFFFIDYQGQRQSIGRTVVSTVPTVQQREGVFNEPIYDPATTTALGNGTFTRSAFPGGVIPVERMDPVALELLQRYPLPTADGTANNYRRTGNERVDQDQFAVRLDQRFASGRDQLFGRLTRFGEQFDPVLPLPDGSGRASGTLGPQRTGSWALATGYTRTLSNTLVNELRIGDTRRAVRRDAAALDGTPSDVLGLPGIPSNARFADTLPTFLVSGYQQLGSPPNTASDFSTRVTEIADTLSWMKGRHLVKAGVDARWEALDVTQPPSPTGSFVFNSLFTDLPGTAGTGQPLASFLLGQVQSFSIDLQQSAIRNRASFQELFVQDDWKLTDRLTLNAGVRYTLNHPSYEASNQAAVLNLDTGLLEYLGAGGQPRAARRLHHFDVGPRFGLAWRATDDDVLRAGYARVFIEMAGITTPFTTPAFPFLQTVSERSLDGIVPAFVLAGGPTVAPIAHTPEAGLGQGVFTVDRDLGSGDVQQWNLSWQRALGGSLTMEVAYAGSKITHVGLPDSNINQLPADVLAIGAPLLQRVPNPFYGTIDPSSSLGEPTITVAQLQKRFPQYTTVSYYRNNVGTTFYQGVTVSFERRFSGGLGWQVGYTRSRLEDDASSVFDASILTGPVANFPVADSFDRSRERDVSTGDIPHVLTASVVWQPRAGWTVSALAVAQSGMPVAATQATNFNAFAGYGTQRPNLVGDPSLPSGQRSAARWFDTGVFAVAPQFTLGSSSRNPVRGPGYANLDLAVTRELRVGPGAVELRAEAFNLFNSTHLGQPSGVFGTPAFGSITSAGDPRVVQLAVKYRFP